MKGRKRKRKSIEVKLGIGYSDKVKRYAGGYSKAVKLKDKFVYAAVQSGKEFMEDLSFIAEKKISLSKAKAIVFGGDGALYISSGIKDYFTGAIYVLSKFHLKRNIKRAFSNRAHIQPVINELIKKDKIDEALGLIGRIIQRATDKKEKKVLKELHTYISQNRKGINPFKYLKDKDIRTKVKSAGAMESNVDKFLAHRFKKRGMSWSVKGALSLLKIKETIANGEWDKWWFETREEKIEIETKPLKQLTASDFWKKERDVVPLIETAIPALRGPDQDKPWVKVLRQLQDIEYYQ